MQSDLRIMLEFQEFLKVRRDPFITPLAPGESYDGAAPNAKAGILAEHP
jgi:hypothetical protein